MCDRCAPPPLVRAGPYGNVRAKRRLGRLTQPSLVRAAASITKKLSPLKREGPLASQQSLNRYAPAGAGFPNGPDGRRVFGIDVPLLGRVEVVAPASGRLMSSPAAIALISSPASVSYSSNAPATRWSWSALVSYSRHSQPSGPMTKPKWT